MSRDDAVTVPNGWILPDGARVLGAPRAVVVDRLLAGRGRHRADRCLVRIADSSSPHDGREGWIDTDRLKIGGVS